MNSTFNRALAAAVLALGGAASVFAQYDNDGYCISAPPASSPGSYSADYSYRFLQNPLFGAGMGGSGTANWTAVCGSISAPVAGRFGFSMGPRGSAQDTFQDFGGQSDDWLKFNFGTNSGDGAFAPQRGPLYGPGFSPGVGGTSYARIYVVRPGTDGEETSNELYTPSLSFYVPASGRRIVTEGVAASSSDTEIDRITVRCDIDVIGDAARVGWTLTNNFAVTSDNPSPTARVGIWFGQQVDLVDLNGNNLGVPYSSGQGTTLLPYITIPGRRPLTVQERFRNAPSTTDPNDVLNPVPTYVNFGAGSAFSYGFQIVNDPSALTQFDGSNGGVSDQTAVDEFVIGNAGLLIAGGAGTTDPGFPDTVINLPGNGNADAAPLSSATSYLQKWQPAEYLSVGQSRRIVSYYRSLSGDSVYSTANAGYAVVVDTPKAITTNPDDPTSFRNTQYTIRVNVDNTGAFTITDQQVAMSSVNVRLVLPAGLHAVGNASTREISVPLNRSYATDNRTEVVGNRVEPRRIGYVDIPFEADDTAFGNLRYTVVVTPQPSFASKTVTGTINVGTKPYLFLRQGANLVSPPWVFGTSSLWSNVLGQRINADFQAYTWNPLLGDGVGGYVPQSNAQRGVGTWIVEKVADSLLGYRELQGNPTQPTDQFPDEQNVADGGYNGLVRLNPGWNLVGNPYNYAFPLGQIVGVPVSQGGEAISLTYQQLVDQGYTDGSFQAYQPSTRSYVLTSGSNARLEANAGYWVYANAAVDLQFPPLYDLFIRSLATENSDSQRFDNWSLQLSAASANAADVYNYAGIVRETKDAARKSYREAPWSPATDAISASLVGSKADMASLRRYSRGKQTFNYQVATKATGPVTISWPNIKSIPSNLAVTIVDSTTRKSINARTTSGYSFTGSAMGTRQFVVTVTPQGTTAQRVGTISSSIVRQGMARNMVLNYVLSGRGGATLKVLDAKGKTLATIANDVDVVAGTNSATWAMVGKDGMPLPNGRYTLEVTATGEGGDTSTRTQIITVSR